MAQITTVSMKGSSSATKPSVTGSLVRTAEERWRPSRRPSFENAAREALDQRAENAAGNAFTGMPPTRSGRKPSRSCPSWR